MARRRQARRGEAARILELHALGRCADDGALSHYVDPDYYDKTYRARRQDVTYYVRLARLLGGPVLEYGIGTGRIAIPIARAGVEVVGVDLSAPMLEGLERRLSREPEAVRRRVRAVKGDMRSARLGRRFPLVLATFNTILHLYERRDVERFFARVRDHLTPRGRFVFDFSIPSPEDLNTDPERSYGAPPIRHPTTGDRVRYAERFEYDPLRQVLLVRMEFRPEGNRPAWTVPLTQRQFFPCEMEALLHYNGFTDLVWSADFADAAPSADADSLVVSCRARRGR